VVRDLSNATYIGFMEVERRAIILRDHYIYTGQDEATSGAVLDTMRWSHKDSEPNLTALNLKAVLCSTVRG
jgi:hypothetical protein